MKYLLPHRFKKIGAIVAPIGFALWICMQFGFVTKVLIFLFGESPATQSNSPYHIVNVCVAILSFFSFLAGIYFVTFSKEKVEDEMVQRTRLDSFQFAALAQIIFIIIIDNWWNENWIPIFHNGGGGHICYDMIGIFTDKCNGQAFL